MQTTTPEHISEMVTETQAHYAVWFLGQARFYRTLFPAMQYRQALEHAGVDMFRVIVEERTADGWAFYDAVKFLAGLERLLAPAD
jgi:hypothetical protein